MEAEEDDIEGGGRSSSAADMMDAADDVTAEGLDEYSEAGRGGNNPASNPLPGPLSSKSNPEV